MGTGTVYRRFPDKTMLIEALFESPFDTMIAPAEEATGAVDPWAGLVRFMVSCVEMQQANRGLKDLLFGQNPAVPRDRFAPQREKLGPTLDTLVWRARESGHLRPDIEASDLAMIQFMLDSVGALSAADHPGQWRRQLTLLLDGLRADSEARTSTPLPGRPVTEAEFEDMCRAAALRH